LSNLPDPSPERLAELRRLDEMPDEQINYDDIPALTEAQLAEMKRARHFRPVKKQVTIRIDADVLAWFKAGGKGYQSRMNAILRQAMLNSN